MKTRKFLFAMFIAFLGLIIHTSCEYEPLGIPQAPPPPAKVSFSTDIQPIFDAKCISCHKSTHNLPLVQGDSYNALIAKNCIVKGDAETSKLYTKVRDGHNPPTTDKLDLIKQWINEGAEDN